MSLNNLKQITQEQQIIEFRKFIYGFEGLSFYYLSTMQKSKEPFFLLSSIDNTNVKFIIRNIDLEEAKNVYSAKINTINNIAEFLNIKDSLKIFLMTTLVSKKLYRLNWRAPLIMSKDLGKGWQIILDS